MMKHSRLEFALLVGTSTFAISIAGAQTASSPSPELEEITITGSRLITNGNESPTPVTVVPVSQIMELQPTTISEALNTLPQFGGSQTSTSGPGSGIRNGAAAFITLRNAGDNHTLVLYDGHRVLPASPQESHASDVDLNLIPQVLLRRVDIVTGGASAIYGADAVSGVVNFITDNNFNGFKADLSKGITTYGDNPTTNASIAFGTRLSDRAHIMGSYEFRDDEGILDPADKYERPFFARVLGGSGSGTPAAPYTSIENSRISNTSFGGKITNATGALAGLANMNFTQNNVMMPFVNGAPVVGSTTVQSGGDGAYYYNSSMKSSLRMHKAFGRFDFDVTDNLSLYLQGSYSQQKSLNYFQSANASFDVGLDNPFLDSVTVNSPTLTTAQFQALRAANPTGSFRMTKFMLAQEADHPVVNEMKFATLYAGLDGKMGDNWNWNLHLGHSWADQDIYNTGNIDFGKFYAAVDTVRVGGNIVCRATQTNATYAGCVPLNPFGPTSENRAALDYVTATTRALTHVKLDEVQTTVSGSPFESWAGPVSIALTGEYHRTTFDIESSQTPEENVDCNGIRFADLSGAPTTGYCNGPLTTNPTVRWGQNTLSPLQPSASIDVAEAAVEAEIPLLAGVSFAEDVSLNAAARFTDYSSTGGDWTWKLGLTWKMNDDIRLRVSRSHDIRAPNLYELYSPPTYSFVNFTDVSAAAGGSGQTGFTRRLQNGNPTLKNEQSNTLSGGFILTPGFLPGFSLSVDAWLIKMKDTILQIRGFDAPIRTACQSSNGTSPYCALYQRPGPNQFPTLITQLLENIATQETWGIDFESSYKTTLAGRPLDLRAFVVYQPKNVFDLGPAGQVDMGGAYGGAPASVGPSPKVRATLIGSYNLTDNFKFSIMEQWRSSMRATSSITPTPTAGYFYAVDRVPSVAYTHLTMTLTVPYSDGKFELYGNIQNLFNKFSEVPVGGAPATIPSRGITPMPIGDDPIGRRYVLGVRLSM